MQKKNILDTFTLQEIKKDIYIYMWKSTDITENQKKKKETDQQKKKNEYKSNYIYTHKVFKYILIIIMKQLTRQQQYNNNDHACARMIII